MPAFPVDLSDLPADVLQQMHKILTRQNEMEMIQAVARQQAIAKFYADNPPKAVDGFGGMTMALDPYWVNYWRWKLKYEPGEEQEVHKWLAKNFDWFRVRHTGTKIQVGYSGIGSAGKRVGTWSESKRLDPTKN